MKKPSKPLAVKVRRLPHARGLPLPAYQTADAAGMDLVAALPPDAPLALEPMQRALVPTGLILEMPSGTEAQIRPRSGLAARHGVTVLNSPGTIDADYRGEVSVILINLGATTVTVARGDRIAQMVLSPVTRCSLTPSHELSQTRRGAGGFGSTGVSLARHKAAPAKNKKAGKTRTKTKVARKNQRRSSAKRPAKR